MSKSIENTSKKEENGYSSSDVQWSVDGNKFLPQGKTVMFLPSGSYIPYYNPTTGKVGFEKVIIEHEKLLILPDPVIDYILKDIKSFWANELLYNKYEFLYKRGVLLYGPPGNGKTSIIELVSYEITEKYQGIIININSEETLRYFNLIQYRLKSIEKKRKIIIVFEDIDGLILEKSIETMLVNILDGNSRMSNVITIATTNYPEKLSERISNRPSRFDRRYEILSPSPEVRKYYIENFVGEIDNINKWIKDTEGFTLDHLKELILSVYVLKYDYNEALNTIKNIINKRYIKPSIKTDAPSSINGFNKNKF